jgi:hypothetical protein
LKALSANDRPELFAKKADNSNSSQYYIGFGFLTNNGTEKRYIKATKGGEETQGINNIFWLTNDKDKIDSRWIQKDKIIGGIIGTGWNVRWKNNDHTSGTLLIS